MSRRELPIKRPDIIGFTHYAYPLSVAQESPGFSSWMTGQFIQIRTKLERPGDYFTDFCFPSLVSSDHYPCLTVDSIHRDSLPVDPWNYIKSRIDQGYYVYTFVDDYYIPDRPFYKTYHLNHDILIYGYDEHNKCLLITGFNKHKVFGKGMLDYATFLRAYDSVVSNEDRVQLVRCLKSRKDFRWVIDLRSIVALLEDYVEERNVTGGGTMYAYGCGVYKPLCRYLRGHLEHGYKLDITAFHILWEHKKCMNLRIRTLHRNSRVAFDDPTALEVEERALQIRNLLIKFMMSGRVANLEKAIRLLCELKELDKAVIRGLIRAVENVLRFS